MDEASEGYTARFETRDTPETDGQLPWSDDLKAAVAAEFKCSPEAFVDLQMRIIQLCEEAREGVLVLRRSELASAVTADENYVARNISGLLERLTLPRRDDWTAKPETYATRDLELWRFDRKHSIIARPLIAISNDADPLLLVSPIFVSDATMYQLSALHYATIHNDSFWDSSKARAYAGARAHEIGDSFEDEVARLLNDAGYNATPRKEITALLEQAIEGDLGDVDVFVVTPCRRHVVVIEAKSLKLCRTEAEVAARMTDYAGKTHIERGKERPDKLLRHLRRVEYIRENAARLGSRLGLSSAPQVHGLVVFDAPQPMNFFMLEEKADGASCIADDVADGVARLVSDAVKD